MAVAGSSINAAHCTMVRGLLTVRWMTTSRDNCVSVDEAVALLQKGEKAIVAPTDIHALRERMA